MMRGPWKSYNAPNGKKYYYNTETKKTQWEKPVFESTGQNKHNSSNNRRIPLEFKIDAPIFVIPLCNDWKLVIWSNGNKFYLDPKGKSEISLNDADSVELLKYINKDKLILLIGFARGYSSSSIDSNIIYDELLEEIQQMKEDLSGEHIESDIDVENHSIKTFIDENINSKSSENIADINEDNNDSNDNLQLISSIDKVKDTNDSETKIRFMQLFDTFNLDKFSTWRNQRIKIENEPVFLLIDNDKDREQLFEDWCSGDHNNATSDTGEISDDVEDEIDSNASKSDDDDEDLEPTKYHYLSHIVNKSNINKDTIFQDIKKEQKALFKEFKIKDFISSQKDQEQFVSTLLFYYKKMNENERKELFKKLLQKYKLQILQSIKNGNSHNDLVNLLDKSKFQISIDDNDSFAIETTLLKMEHFINNMSQLRKLMEEEPTYYIIGIKDKTIQLFDYLYDLIHEP
ncbi:hypothetical protein C6P45_004843 [Maudiozyma exigua]|uniref:WW domain-containing protein n=1 Tax=Maudiozyma exigua TaxID=34358 RepID=A0A9P6WC51_MAUEX|nr:hypothetical protein C6P45_004843 [Kazachstania exigua]